MNKICTDIEQSKKLIELGLDVNTADMMWDDWKLIDEGWKLSVGYYPEIEKDYGRKCHPAWSLNALMNMLPSDFTEVGKYSTTIYEIKIRKYNLIEDVNLYQIAYGNYKFHEEDGHSYWKDMINTGEKENLIDAAFQMICWLKENGKL